MGELKELILEVLEKYNITQKELCNILEVSEASLKRLKGTLPYGNVSGELKQSVQEHLEQLLESDNAIEKREGQTERKPKYVEDGENIIIYYGGNKEVVITKDILRDIKNYYCTGKFTVGETALKFGLLDEEFFAIKTAFGIVKRSFPYLEEDLDKFSPEELAEKTRIEKKRLYFQKLEQGKYKDQERELKKHHQDSFLMNKLIDNLNLIERNPVKVVHRDFATDEYQGVMQLSDLHFGTKVDLLENQYSTNIAQERLEKLFAIAIDTFNKYDISKVSIMFTGDMSNVMIHKDKEMAQESARTVAMLKLSDILAQLINDLVEKGFKVEISGILGNESRLADEFSSIDRFSVDSMDFVLHQMLKLRLSNNKGLTFVNECDRLSDVVKVQDKNFLLIHGDTIKGDINKAINYLKLKHMEKGIKIDYVLFGHIHDPLVSCGYARSGALVGADSYSSHKLNIPISHVSQNIGVVSSRGINITPIKL